MPDPSRLDSLGPLADQRRLSALRMMSGQFPDEILDPEIRELGFVVDRDAIRARLEQEIGFADFGKYAREQFIEGLPRISRIKMPDGSFLDSADLAERIRRHFPEPGPQSGLLEVPRGSAPNSVAAALAAHPPALRPLSPALSARVHALLSSQRDPTSPSPTA